MFRVWYNFLILMFAIIGCAQPTEDHSQPSLRVINSTNSRFDNEYGEFQVVQSNVLHINKPRYKLPRKNLFKRQTAVGEQIESLTVAPTILTQLQLVTDQSPQQERASQLGKHKHQQKKKKKKNGGFHGLMHMIKKWMPKFGKHMHGPSMFMMGMAQANFHNFVMQALMMSKMALFSVIFMIIREAVFGDKDEPVKYYNFGYDHHLPKHHYHYDPLPPSPIPPESEDYPYDYNRRRRRSTGATFR